MNANSSTTGLRAYRITIKGSVDEEFVSAYCPPGTLLDREGATISLRLLQADQSAVVGLVRHLHNLGCTLLVLETDWRKP